MGANSFSGLVNRYTQSFYSKTGPHKLFWIDISFTRLLDFLLKDAKTLGRCQEIYLCVGSSGNRPDN